MHREENPSGSRSSQKDLRKIPHFSPQFLRSCSTGAPIPRLSSGLGWLKLSAGFVSSQTSVKLSTPAKVKTKYPCSAAVSGTHHLGVSRRKMQSLPASFNENYSFQRAAASLADITADS